MWGFGIGSCSALGRRRWIQCRGVSVELGGPLDPVVAEELAGMLRAFATVTAGEILRRAVAIAAPADPFRVRRIEWKADHAGQPGLSAAWADHRIEAWATKNVTGWKASAMQLTESANPRIHASTNPQKQKPSPASDRVKPTEKRDTVRQRCRSSCTTRKPCAPYF